MTCLRANNSSFDKLLCAIFPELFYFQQRTSYIFTGLFFRLESNILLGEFIIHVTYILNAITGNIDIGNIDADILLLFMLSSLSSLRNHWNV